MSGFEGYNCPKCGGNDYFMSSKNVIKGIGGIYGNRGGTKKFPVCRDCGEIMDFRKTDREDLKKYLQIGLIIASVYIVIAIIAKMT